MKTDRSKMAPLSVDGKVLVEELRQVLQELAGLLGVKSDDNLVTRHADLPEADGSGVVHENLKALTGRDRETVGVVGVVDGVISHEITLTLRFEGDNLKSASLYDHGKPVLLFMRPRKAAEKGGRR